MPKTRSLTPKEVIKILEKSGFILFLFSQKNCAFV